MCPQLHGLSSVFPFMFRDPVRSTVALYLRLLLTPGRTVSQPISQTHSSLHVPGEALDPTNHRQSDPQRRRQTMALA